MKQELQNVDRQYDYIHQIFKILQDKMLETGVKLKAFTDTYGCQQNIADTQKINGMLVDMGFVMTTDEKEADFVLVNTCAIREHAESKILSVIGEFSHLKKNKPNMLIAVCGCMVQQEYIVERLKKSYPFVDLVFGTHAINRFPEILFKKMNGKKRVFDITGDEKGEIIEGLPIMRDGTVRAWLSIMYGCNNFCTYCIVPYVRGRERSRKPEDIVNELKILISEGFKEITLLGQNVNSYGKDLDENIDFSDLLKLLNDVEGEFILRFMTSHPKDASEKLFDTMASCEKVAKQLHLPFQSGSNKILKAMNRGYTKESYRNLIAYAKTVMPDITLSSDIIVGFPNESLEDFEDTYKLVTDIEFNVLYTFIFSKRSGTPAATMEDIYSKEFKQKNFEKLLDTQNNIALKKNKEFIGKTIKVIVDGKSKNKDYPISTRSFGGNLVLVGDDNLKDGDIISVLVEDAGMRTVLARKI